jgi:hypothetical protein
MMRKFVGDKSSIEATSTDGRKWSVLHYDRGHLTSYPTYTQADLDKLVSTQRMKPATPGVR